MFHVILCRDDLLNVSNSSISRGLSLLFQRLSVIEDQKNRLRTQNIMLGFELEGRNWQLPIASTMKLQTDG